jgi:glyoxylase-like metal-dependent hydrolase (beta-lactamase superfamily II)
MMTIASGMRYVDVGFRHRPQIIATAVLDSAAGVALVDPGPTSCLQTLREELRAGGADLADIRAILLTHIHLDHAGATGTLVRENPGIRVYVHEVGAPHLVDPTRLLASATRLYGAAMDDLWGAFLPVPASNVTALAGGERLEVGGRTLDVAATPGHASHHVCYFDAATGVAFIGDMGGVHIPKTSYILPPTSTSKPGSRARIACSPGIRRRCSSPTSAPSIRRRRTCSRCWTRCIATRRSPRRRWRSTPAPATRSAPHTS